MSKKDKLGKPQSKLQEENRKRIANNKSPNFKKWAHKWFKNSSDWVKDRVFSGFGKSSQLKCDVCGKKTPHVKGETFKGEWLCRCNQCRSEGKTKPQEGE